jgi:hypothetical protein
MQKTLFILKLGGGWKKGSISLKSESIYQIFASKQIISDSKRLILESKPSLT